MLGGPADDERAGVIDPLSRNDADYRWLTRWLRRIDTRRRPETALRGIQEVAHFAAYQHTGRFADGVIENLALDIGRRIPDPAPLAQVQADGRLHVLHVVTSLEPIGGVTQAIRRWVRADGGSRHTVLATSQAAAMPRPVVTAVADNGGAIVELSAAAPLIEKAARLRAAARAGADVVVVHHYPHDVVPTVAFATPGGPPVAIANHSDQMFWLGSSVADAIVNLRSGGVRVSADRRFPRRNLLLPLPLDAAGRPSREEARQALGVPDEQAMLLSVGRGNKYRPDGRTNFFRAGCAILARNPAAHLHVVGVTPDEAAVHLPPGPHDRFHFHGLKTDPGAYQVAADVYLEGFPFGSQTALLEAGLAGVPAVGACAPPCPLLVCQDAPLDGLLDNPPDEAGYVERVSALVRDPAARRRLGDRFREQLLAAHTGDGWLRTLHAVYAELAGLTHTPGPIPDGEAATTDSDAGLARWCDSLGVFAAAGPGWQPGDERTRVAFVVAYRLREKGCYRDPGRLLLSALWQGGNRRAAASALVKLPLHWLRRRSRI